MVKLNVVDQLPEKWEKEIDDLINKNIDDMIEMFSNVNKFVAKGNTEKANEAASAVMTILSRVTCNVLLHICTHLMSAGEVNKFINSYTETINNIVKKAIKERMLEDDEE